MGVNDERTVGPRKWSSGPFFFEAVHEPFREPFMSCFVSCGLEVDEPSLRADFCAEGRRAQRVVVWNIMLRPPPALKAPPTPALVSALTSALVRALTSALVRALA